MTTTITSSGLLSDRFAQPADEPELYVRGINGIGDQLLDRQAALALFKEASADPRLDVAGHPDTVGGFNWPMYGAIPPRVHTVRPVALPARPPWPTVLSVTIVLVFPAGDGTRRERRFHADVVGPLDAYNIACCLWSARDTGRGALSAALIDDADGRVYEVCEPANTCGWFPPDLVAKIAASCTDHFAESPKTGAPGGEAIPPSMSPCRERRTTRAGRRLVDDPPGMTSSELEGAPSAPPAIRTTEREGTTSMDQYTEALAKPAPYIGASNPLTKVHRVSGPMEHATGKNCSPVPLHRLGDLVESLHDLSEDRALDPLPTFDGFPTRTGNSAGKAQLTETLRAANAAGRGAAAAKRS